MISSFFVKRIVKGDNIKTRKVFKYVFLANYCIAIGKWTSVFFEILIKTGEMLPNFSRATTYCFCAYPTSCMVSSGCSTHNERSLLLKQVEITVGCRFETQSFEVFQWSFSGKLIFDRGKLVLEERNLLLKYTDFLAAVTTFSAQRVNFICWPPSFRRWGTVLSNVVLRFSASASSTTSPAISYIFDPAILMLL